MEGTPAQLAAYVGKSERTVHRWLASGKLPHTRLPGGIIEVDDAVLLGHENEQKRAMLATLQRIEEKLDRLSAKPTPIKYESRSMQGDLPAHLTALQDYCKEHGYSTTSVRRWIEQGKVPIHEGTWRRGRSMIRYALDEDGKKAIDQLYRKPVS